MSKTRILILILMIFAIPITVLAFEAKAGNSVYIGPDKTVQHNLYAAGANVTVEGNVEGDVICAGQSININGNVGGSVRVAGQTININGSIAKGAQTFGSNIVIGANANISWDMLMAGAFTEIRGYIGRDLHGAGGNVTISGEIGKDVKLRLDDRVNKKEALKTLIIEDGAKINGNLYYTAGAEGTISDQAIIAGETGFSMGKKHDDTNSFSFFWSTIYSIFAALVIGLVIISIFRKHVEEIINKMLEKSNASIIWGIGLMFITPLLVFFLAITLIGLPLGLIVLVLWLILMYTAKIITAILIGKKITNKLKFKNISIIWAMVIGVIVSWFVFSLPIIGWLFCMIATWWATGGLILYLKKS